MKRMLRILVLLASLLSIQAQAQVRSKVGVNVNSAEDWTGQIMFVDIMKHARPWMSCDQDLSNWDTGVADRVAKDANGYPLSMPQSIPGQSSPQVVHTYISADFPVGSYTVLYDGEAEAGQEALDFRVGAFSVKSIISKQPGRYVVSVERFDGAVRVFLAIRSSKASNPVRNIRMIMPGHEATHTTQMFYPPFVDRLGSLSTLRFMDTQNTNFNNAVSWGERTTPSFYTQADGRGVAVEYLVSLANQTNTDPWFSIPEAADDNYVRQFARLLNSRLLPGRKVYVEYANEIWNGGFTANLYCQRMGESMRSTCPQSFSEYSDSFQSVVVYQARRSAEIFKIFEEEITNPALSVIEVIGSQAENPGVADRLFAALEVPCVNPNGMWPDALAIAPYFGHNAPAVSANQLLSFSSDYLKTNTKNGIIGSKQRAARFGVDLIAYEGGQHLNSANGASAVDVAVANRDARMGALYDDLFRLWFEENAGGVFVTYNYVHDPSEFGAWGLLEHQNQDPATSAKYQAVVNRAANRYTTIVGTATPTPGPTVIPTVAPTATTSPTPRPTNSPTATPTVGGTPTRTQAPQATNTATRTPTPTATRTPTSRPTDSPTVSPTRTPTMVPSLTPVPTLWPTSTATARPTSTTAPTSTPTSVPTLSADTRPPVLRILGSRVVNVALNSKYVDAGATAFDERDGDLTQKIRISVRYRFLPTQSPLGVVDTTQLRTYVVTYRVRDSAGNEAKPVNRLVRVRLLPGLWPR